MSDDIRRNMPLFPIGIVMKLTELTARQVRYYEQHGLIHPARTDGNQRLFSFNDVDRLLEIKALIEKGLNMAGIKQVLSMKDNASKMLEAQEQTAQAQQSEELSDRELRRMLKQQIVHGGRKAENSLIRGELSRFFH